MMGRVLLAAILAGIVAGLVMSGVQHWRVTPIIIAAEAYETGEMPNAQSHGQSQEVHDHGASTGTLKRTALTLIANVITGVAFSLVMAGAALITGLPLTAGNGALWGLAGLATFMLAPWAGLPPELPGMPAGALESRQIWWWGTVAATAAGIALFVLSQARSTPARMTMCAVAIAIIAVPHIIGAPHPEDAESLVPASLATAFAANSIVTGAIFWVVLGVSLGWLFGRNPSNEATP